MPRPPVERRPLHRRQFLRLTGLGVASAAALAWLPACVTDPDDVTVGELPGTPLGREVSRAHRLGRPTLVFVVPDDEDRKWAQGSLFGALLNNGDDQLLRELACVHVVCATRAEIQALSPDSAPPPRVPAVLVELGADGAVTRDLVDVQVGEQPSVDFGDADWEKMLELGDERYREWVAPFRDGIVARLLADGDAEVFKRRAAAVRATLTPAETSRVDAALAGSAAADDALVERAAALFRADDAFSTDDEDRWSQRLATVARARIVQQQVPGSQWATQTGCGCEIEGVESDSQVACGMGFVPAAGQRFLWLFAENA